MAATKKFAGFSIPLMLQESNDGMDVQEVDQVAKKCQLSAGAALQCGERDRGQLGCTREHFIHLCRLRRNQQISRVNKAILCLTNPCTNNEEKEEQ